LVGVVALGAVIGGCGGGGDSSSTLTKAEFVKQANAICATRKQEWESGLASYNEEVKEKKATSDPKAQEEIAVVQIEETMLPAVKTQLTAMEDLAAPEGEEAAVTKMLGGLSKEIKQVEKEGIYGLSKTHQFEDFEEEAKKLGLDCSFE
jgi:hypothetical protein